MTSSSTDLRDTGRRVILREAGALEALAGALDDRFAEALGLLMAAKGRVIVSGMGKSGHIARKIAATFASTGTPAHFVHPAQLAIITIAIFANGHFELQLRIGLIRLAAAKVPRKARTADHHAGETPIEDGLFVDNANIDVALFEDAVFGEQAVQVIQHALETVAPSIHIVQQLRR